MLETPAAAAAQTFAQALRGGRPARSRSDPNLGLRRCVINCFPSPRGRSSEGRLHSPREAQAVLQMISPRHQMLSPRQIIAAQPAPMRIAPPIHLDRLPTMHNPAAALACEQNATEVALKCQSKPSDTSSSPSSSKCIKKQEPLDSRSSQNNVSITIEVQNNDSEQLETGNSGAVCISNDDPILSIAHERVKPLVSHRRSLDTDTFSNSDTKTILSDQECGEEIVDPVRFEVTPCRLASSSDQEDYENESEYSPRRMEAECPNEIPQPPRTAPLLDFRCQDREMQQGAAHDSCSAATSSETVSAPQNQLSSGDQTIGSAGKEAEDHLYQHQPVLVEPNDVSNSKLPENTPNAVSATETAASSATSSSSAVLEQQLALLLAENERLRAAVSQNPNNASMASAVTMRQNSVNAVDFMKWDAPGQSSPVYMVAHPAVEAIAPCSVTEGYPANSSMLIAPRVLHTEFVSPVKQAPTENMIVSLRTPPKMKPDAVVPSSSLQDSLPSTMQVHGLPSPERRHQSPNVARGLVAVSTLDPPAQPASIQYNGQQVPHVKPFKAQSSSSRVAVQTPFGTATLGGA